MMKAVHVISSKPTVSYYSVRNSEADYHQKDFEILTTILSALEWRKNNGTIFLYADDTSAAFFDELGLLSLWDAGVDTVYLEEASKGINCDVFWSFGKILALGRERAPCFIMDTDLVVWKNIKRLIYQKLMSLHRESLHFSAYVDPKHLFAPRIFSWDGLNWKATPCSAALLYFSDNDFKDTYVDKALSFMRFNPVQREETAGTPAHPIFVEQRLLPMWAGMHNEPIGWFLQDHRGLKLIDGTRNTTFTHLWNSKASFFTDTSKRIELCKRCAHRIRRDFPEYVDRLRRTEQLRRHF